ncbi:MAG TPA: LPS export ABC transporter periplasmic protein LptC [Vicinamibacterales bacterium]|nr:LPS export ABC transporter periplasmic protein LptC [Vicinamibacterales bacterium]
MARWQRHARAALAVVAVTVIGAVAYTIRPREVAAPPPKIERTSPDAVIEVQGGDAIQLKGKDQDLRVEYRVQTTNKDGETALRDVKIMVNNRGGRNYVVTGKEAFVGKENKSFDVRGDVKMETDDGLVATSQQATYTEAERMVRIPGQVQFSQGRMSGSGIGFTFDEQRDVMWILDKADVKFAAKDNLAPMAFTSGTFGYARRDRYMRFEKTMHMERDAQLIDADSAMVRLFPDREEPDYVELRNGASVTGTGPSSALKSMTARDINLDYADDGRTLQNATLAGKAEIQVAGKGAAGTQRLAGDFMDIGLEPDGSVRHLAARDGVVVTLPATKDAAARTIRSNSLAAQGNAQGIRDMTFSEGVEYREPGAKGQAGRTVRARNLQAGLDAAAGTLQVATFVGNVDFTDGPLHATSAEARYEVAAGKLALLGKSPEPHIVSDTVSIDAVTIDVTLNPRTMTAKGNVRSTLLPPKKPAPGTAETRRPGLLAEKEAVSIIAESLIYDEAARKADYAGKAKLLQGQTTIQANTLVLDEAKGDLTANGKVITNLVIADKQEDAKKDPAEKPAAKPKPMIARAETFTYSDQTRTATYTTTAQLDGDQGNLSAGKLELQLAKGENSLERLDANGAVVAVVDRRTVTGTRLVYSATDDKYVVTGVPVKMVDADCQETSGKTLTFWKASDRVQVDGNNEVRTQTKGGGKCTAGQ